jgi:hypothetical protein
MLRTVWQSRPLSPRRTTEVDAFTLSILFRLYSACSRPGPIAELPFSCGKVGAPHTPTVLSDTFSSSSQPHGLALDGGLAFELRTLYVVPEMVAVRGSKSLFSAWRDLDQWATPDGRPNLQRVSTFVRGRMRINAKGMGIPAGWETHI